MDPYDRGDAAAASAVRCVIVSVPNPDSQVVTIVATYHDGKASCIVSWNGRDMVLDCDTVRRLAQAMFTAAAVAEAEAALVAGLRGLHGYPKYSGEELAVLVLRMVRAKRGAGVHGDRQHVVFVPGVSGVTGAPFVHAICKPYEPQRYAPDELRGMADDWYQIANAAEHDAILRYALAEVTDLTNDQTQQVFDLCRNLRPTGLRDEDRLSP